MARAGLGLVILSTFVLASPAFAQPGRGGDPSPAGRGEGRGSTVAGRVGGGPDRLAGEGGRRGGVVGLATPGSRAGLGELTIVPGDSLAQRPPGYTGPQGFLFADERHPRTPCADASEDLGIEGTFGCMSPETYAPPRGFRSWLRLNVEPRYTQVFVNGRYAGTAQQYSQPYRRLELALGAQFVELRAPGYAPLAFWIRQERDVLATFNGRLQKK